MRVLVVEDEPQVLRVLTRVLEGIGHTVDAVESADAALAQLHRGEFDALIADVLLPGANGCRLARNVQRLVPTMRVLLISGYSLGDLVDKMPECAGLPLIQKPFGLTDLRTKLAQIGVT